jgi:hypothetical protein
MFDKLQSQETKFPQKVRCARCGQMANCEDLDFSPDDWVMAAYICDSCSWWTEWEITHDGAGGIQSSSLYYRASDSETTIAWYEARHWPGFWMPDGLTVPDYAQEANQ